MIAGRLDADYVGTDNCTEVPLPRYAVAGTSASASRRPGLGRRPACPCELRVLPRAGEPRYRDITERHVRLQDADGHQEDPGAGQSLICLKCHGEQSLEPHRLAGQPARLSRRVLLRLPQHPRRAPAQKVARSRDHRPLLQMPPDVRPRSAFPRTTGPRGEDLLRGLSRPPRHLEPRQPEGHAGEERLRPLPCRQDRALPLRARGHRGDCRAATSRTGRSTASSCATRQPFLCLQCHTGHNTAAPPGVEDPGDEGRPTSPPARPATPGSTAPTSRGSAKTTVTR